jgi:protein TonB
MMRTSPPRRKVWARHSALLASLLFHALAAAGFVCLAPGRVPAPVPPALPVLVLSASLSGDAPGEGLILPAAGEDAGAAPEARTAAVSEPPALDTARLRPRKRPAAQPPKTRAPQPLPTPSPDPARAAESATFPGVLATAGAPAKAAGAAEAGGPADPPDAGAAQTGPNGTKGRAAGAGPDRPEAARAYFGTILARLEQVKRYPDAARRFGREGTVLVRFELDRAGTLMSWRIEKGSGQDDLDREVEAMVRQAAPFPPFPETLARERLVLVVPVSFSLRQG